MPAHALFLWQIIISFSTYDFITLEFLDDFIRKDIDPEDTALTYNFDFAGYRDMNLILNLDSTYYMIPLIAMFYVGLTLVIRYFSAFIDRFKILRWFKNQMIYSFIIQYVL